MRSVVRRCRPSLHPFPARHEERKTEEAYPLLRYAPIHPPLLQSPTRSSRADNEIKGEILIMNQKSFKQESTQSSSFMPLDLQSILFPSSPLRPSLANRKCLKEVRSSQLIISHSESPLQDPTDIFSSRLGLKNPSILQQIPLGRFGTTDEVADAALFLIKNPYANNCVLNLDGGLSAV